MLGLGLGVDWLLMTRHLRSYIPRSVQRDIPTYPQLLTCHERLRVCEGGCAQVRGVERVYLYREPGGH